MSPHVKVCNFTGYVHPQSTEKLTATKALHEGMQLCHGGGEHCLLNILTLIVNQTFIRHSIP